MINSCFQSFGLGSGRLLFLPERGLSSSISELIQRYLLNSNNPPISEKVQRSTDSIDALMILKHVRRYTNHDSNSPVSFCFPPHLYELRQHQLALNSRYTQNLLHINCLENYYNNLNGQ